MHQFDMLHPICCVIAVYVLEWRDNGDDLMISLNIIICRNRLHVLVDVQRKFEKLSRNSQKLIRLRG